jgi:hypothetical protein
MLDKKIVLKISSIVLLLVAAVDILRGFLHTFSIRYAMLHGARIEPDSDSLTLMGAFGISNFLTGFLYLLIIWKAKKIVPYVLLIIPLSYFLGGMGVRYSNVVLPADKFRGQYIMSYYLSICLLVALFYFVVVIINKLRNENK